MKASELRIGNLVFVRDKETIQVLEVQTIDDIGVNLESSCWYDGSLEKDYDGCFDKEKSLCGYGDIVEPIPLTEEWLQKFGFHEDWKFGFLKSLGSVDLSIDVYGGFGVVDFGNDPPEYTRLSDINPKYVHQLQNLYFALTGEELQIVKP